MPFPQKEAVPLTRLGRLNGWKCKKVYRHDGINKFPDSRSLADLEPSCRFNLCLVARQYEQHAGNKCNSGSKQERIVPLQIINTYRNVISRVNSAHHQLYKRQRGRRTQSYKIV